MSDYTQVTDFSIKDSLSSGDSDKVALGSDIDVELSAISTAIASKVDEPSSPSTNDVLTWNGSAVAWAAPAASLPVGSVVPYAGTSEPSGWLFADGRSLAQVGTYADLYAVVGTTYGNSAGGANFDLPDLRFRVPVGPDNMGTAKGAASRSTGVTYSSGAGDEASTGGSGTSSEVVTHTHSVSVTGTGSGTASAANGLAPQAGGSLTALDNSTGTSTNGIAVKGNNTGLGSFDPSHTHSVSISSISGSGTASAPGGAVSAAQNMQPFIVLNYIIKY
jgi:microcystin-dependent protein